MNATDFERSAVRFDDVPGEMQRLEPPPRMSPVGIIAGFIVSVPFYAALAAWWFL